MSPSSDENLWAPSLARSGPGSRLRLQRKCRPGPWSSEGLTGPENLPPSSLAWLWAGGSWRLTTGVSPYGRLQHGSCSPKAGRLREKRRAKRKSRCPLDDLVSEVTYSHFCCVPLVTQTDPHTPRGCVGGGAMQRYEHRSEEPQRASTGFHPRSDLLSIQDEQWRCWPSLWEGKGRQT